jgi:hypothetical protein
VSMNNLGKAGSAVCEEAEAQGSAFDKNGERLFLLGTKVNGNVFDKAQLLTFRSQKLEATFAGGLFFDLLEEISAPHSGQSSQLFLNENDGMLSFL